MTYYIYIHTHAYKYGAKCSLALKNDAEFSNTSGTAQSLPIAIVGGVVRLHMSRKPSFLMLYYSSRQAGKAFWDIMYF